MLYYEGVRYNNGICKNNIGHVIALTWARVFRVLLLGLSSTSLKSNFISLIMCWHVSSKRVIKLDVNNGNKQDQSQAHRADPRVVAAIRGSADRVVSGGNRGIEHTTSNWPDTY